MSLIVGAGVALASSVDGRETYSLEVLASKLSSAQDAGGNHYIPSGWMGDVE